MGYDISTKDGREFRISATGAGTLRSAIGTGADAICVWLFDLPPDQRKDEALIYANAIRESVKKGDLEKDWLELSDILEETEGEYDVC